MHLQTSGELWNFLVMPCNFGFEVVKPECTSLIIVEVEKVSSGIFSTHLLYSGCNYTVYCMDCIPSVIRVSSRFETLNCRITNLLFAICLLRGWPEQSKLDREHFSICTIPELNIVNHCYLTRELSRSVLSTRTIQNVCSCGTQRLRGIAEDGLRKNYELTQPQRIFAQNNGQQLGLEMH